jgi:hypothetical protein
MRPILFGSVASSGFYQAYFVIEAVALAMLIIVQLRSKQ